MKKGFKIALYSAVGIVGLIVISLIVLVNVINLNHYKPQISAAVEKATGRKLDIAGKIGWSLFPSIGVSVGDVTLSNPPGFGDKPFAKVGEADLQVRLLPLIVKKLEFNKIILKNTRINLLINAQGKNNWQDFTKNEAKPSQTKIPTTQKPTTKEVKKNVKQTLDFAVDSIVIQNANINWQDDLSGQHFQIGEVDFETRNLGPNQSFPITLKFILHNKQTNISGNVSLTGNILLQPGRQKYHFNKLNISGTVTNHNLKKAPSLSYSLTTSIAANLKDQTLVAKDVVLKLGNLVAKTAVTGKDIIDTPVFRGTLTTNTFDLKAILSDFGMAVNTASKNALTAVNLKTTWAASPKFVKFDHLVAQVDATKITGDLDVNHFDQPAIDFDLKMNTLNLDHYRLTGKPEQKEKSTKQTTKPSAAQPQSTELNRLSPNGTLTIAKLITNNMTMTHVKLNVTGNNGIIKIAPFSADLYQGNTTGNTTIDMRGTAPKYSITETLNNIQMAPLLKDLADSSKLSGVGNMWLSINMAGNTAQQMLRNLNGSFKVRISNANYKGVDVNYQFNRIMALAQKKTTDVNNTGQTSFGNISGSGTIKRGVVYNPDLLLQSPDIQITGKGTADLNTQRLNYSIALSKTGFNISVPVIITGTFSNPAFRPNVAALAEMLIKGVIQKNIKNLIQPQKIIEGAGDAPIKGIKDIKKLLPGF